jgi:N utilization substance protein A
MGLTFDTEAIRLITLFETISGVRVKDCLVDEGIVYFIVEEGRMGIAIGKEGDKIKRAEAVIGKRIKLFEFSEDLETFVKKLIPQTNSVRIDKDTIEIEVDRANKALVLGRDRKKLKLYRQILQRVHGPRELIVK